jgi:hypothetical protein
MQPTHVYKMQLTQKFHITQFVASLVICLLTCDLLADTPQIRVSIAAHVEDGDDSRFVSALSHEFRKLDGVLVTDTRPALKISCGAMTSDNKMIAGYFSRSWLPRATVV